MHCFFDGTELTSVKSGADMVGYVYHCPKCDRDFWYNEAQGQYEANMEVVTKEEMEERKLNEG